MEFPAEYRKGFDDPDGTLEEYLDWGYQIGFVYEDIPYRTDGTPNGEWGIYEKDSEKCVLSVDTENAAEFLEAEFKGKTVREILEIEAYITELY